MEVTAHEYGAPNGTKALTLRGHQTVRGSEDG
jgi:hypothetical protein